MTCGIGLFYRSFTAKDQKSLVLDLTNSTCTREGDRPLCVIDVPQEGYMMHPAAIIDPIDRLAYSLSC